jgi:hypothetical protein
MIIIMNSFRWEAIYWIKDENIRRICFLLFPFQFLTIKPMVFGPNEIIPHKQGLRVRSQV